MLETRSKEGERPRPALERLLLGDPARVFVAPVLVVALALMLHGYGAMVAATNPSLDAFRKDPRGFVGEPFAVSFGRVAEVGERGFRLHRDGAAIDVIIADVDIAQGAIVSVRGMIRPDLRLEGREFRIHRGRRIKWLVGGVVLFFSLLIAGREVKSDA